MNYDEKILRVLAEAGQGGLSVQKISRHVFNACNTFFETVDFEEVHRYVQQYLLRNSKNPDSIIENTGARGIYRINPISRESQQLMLRFCDKEETEEEIRPVVDRSLSLF